MLLGFSPVGKETERKNNLNPRIITANLVKKNSSPQKNKVFHPDPHL